MYIKWCLWKCFVPDEDLWQIETLRSWCFHVHSFAAVVPSSSHHSSIRWPVPAFSFPQLHIRLCIVPQNKGWDSKVMSACLLIISACFWLPLCSLFGLVCLHWLPTCCRPLSLRRSKLPFYLTNSASTFCFWVLTTVTTEENDVHLGSKLLYFCLIGRMFVTLSGSIK